MAIVGCGRGAAPPSCAWSRVSPVDTSRTLLATRFAQPPLAISSDHGETWSEVNVPECSDAHWGTRGIVCLGAKTRSLYSVDSTRGTWERYALAPKGPHPALFAREAGAVAVKFEDGSILGVDEVFRGRQVRRRSEDLPYLNPRASMVLADSDIVGKRVELGAWCMRLTRNEVRAGHCEGTLSHVAPLGTWQAFEVFAGASGLAFIWATSEQGKRFGFWGAEGAAVKAELPPGVDLDPSGLVVLPDGEVWVASEHGLYRDRNERGRWELSLETSTCLVSEKRHVFSEYR